MLHLNNNTLNVSGASLGVGCITGRVV